MLLNTFVLLILTFLPVFSEGSLVTNNQPNKKTVNVELNSIGAKIASIQLVDPIKLEARIDIPLELNLEKALNIAAMQNLEIIQGQYQKNIQKWKLWENIGNFLPNYKVGISDQRFDGTFLVGGVFPVMALTSNANAFMRFDYPFFQGGKGFFSTLSAKNTYKSSKENLSFILNNTLLDVTRAYNKLLAEHSQFDVLEKSVEEARAEVELNKNLETQGVGTRFDVLQAEAQLAEQEQQLISQQAIIREAAIDLARILNLEQDTDIKPDLNDLKTKELFSINRPITELISVAEENRPEIRRARFEYNAQRNKIWIAFSDFLPQANFYGQYGGTGHVFFHRTKIAGITPDAIGLDDSGNPILQMVSRGKVLYQTFDSGIDLNQITNVSNVIMGAGKPFAIKTDDSLMANKFIGIQVDWPIANGLGLPATSRINAARNQAKLLKTSLEIIDQKVEQEVRVVYLQAQTTQKLLEVAEKRVAAATEALKLAKARLENGVGINTELLNAQKQYKESLASQVNAIIDYNNSQAGLLHTLGIISVNKLLGKN